MTRLALAFLIFLFGAPSLAHGQIRAPGGAFAAVPTPAQPPQTGVPSPIPTPSPGAGVPRAPAPPAAKPEEQLRIVADPATNSLIIFGTAQEFQNIKNILKELDAVPRQVLLDVLIAEVTLTDNQTFGVEFEIFRRSHPTIFGQTFESQGAARSGLLPAPPTDSAGDIISGALTQFGSGMSGVIGRSSAVRAFINAKAEDGRIKILSAPSVLATDNRPARIQVGTEEPIATGSTTVQVGTAASSTSIQYRNTGRIVTVIPQVNTQGLVNLQILAEVSQLGGSVMVGPDSYPRFLTRQAETTAVVQDGDTLVIGGIIADSTNRDRVGIPYLMDIPVIGRFFGTTRDTKDRTELIMLITPHVIRNRDESRAVTEDFKVKLLTIRNELERMRRDREKDLEKLKSQALEQKPAPQPLPSETPPPPVEAPASPAPIPAPPAGSGTSAPSDSQNAAPMATMPPASQARAQPGTPAPRPAQKPTAQTAKPRPESSESPAPPPAADFANKKPVSPAPEEPSTPASATIPRDSTGESRKGERQSVQTKSAGERVQSVKAKEGAPSPPPKPAVEQHARIQIWTVQVASFVQEKDAASLAKKLTEKGYDVYIIPADIAGKTYHRVQVGELKSRKDAAALQESLKTAEKFDQAFIAVR